MYFSNEIEQLLHNHSVREPFMKIGFLSLQLLESSALLYDLCSFYGNYEYLGF